MATAKLAKSGLEAVLVQTSVEGITTITINRPDKRNAVDTPTAKELYAAFRAFEDDPQQKIAILTGSNGTFCAGFDLKTVQASSEPAPPVTTHSRGPMGPSRLQLSKPLIAAVAGHAVAGGLELALLADLRVAEEDAIFGVFCRRWGVPLIDGGTIRLPSIIGFGRAMDMILTGRPVDGKEAYQIGLANRLVPRGQSLAVAQDLARDLLHFPQECMRSDRRSAYYGAFNASTFEDALSFEFEHGVKVVDTEAVAGARRFASGAGRHGSFSTAKPKL